MEAKITEEKKNPHAVQSKDLFKYSKGNYTPYSVQSNKATLLSAAPCLSRQHVYEEKISQSLLLSSRSSNDISCNVKCSMNSAEAFRLHLVQSTICAEHPPKKKPPQRCATSSTVHLHGKASIISHTVRGHLQLLVASHTSQLGLLKRPVPECYFC